ncbi:MAG: type II toxin-antitoxin system RelE/ParE family toxin [Desulfomonilaceae bacterium]
MKILRTDHFKKDYKKLHPDIRKQVVQKLKFLAKDLNHPSLRTRKLKATIDLWEFRITANYRAVFRMEGENCLLLGVGTHRIVDRI